MSPNEPPARLSEQMLLCGAVVFFGPDYLKNSLFMLKHLKGALAGMAVFSAEKIGDLVIPNGPVRAASMTFFHRKPAGADWGKWGTALLAHVELSSPPPKGLGVADRSPQTPAVELVPVDRAGEMQLILTWTRPLEASHLARTARAIEASYLENGGRYGKPGLFKRLRGLLP